MRQFYLHSMGDEKAAPNPCRPTAGSSRTTGTIALLNVAVLAVPSGTRQVVRKLQRRFALAKFHRFVFEQTSH
jgi:hypothetical protein